MPGLPSEPSPKAAYHQWAGAFEPGDKALDEGVSIFAKQESLFVASYSAGDRAGLRSRRYLDAGELGGVQVGD